MVEITVKTFDDACILIGVLGNRDVYFSYYSSLESYHFIATRLDIDQFKSDCDKIGFTEYELTDIK